jgi:Calcineurin-like phosphoesterase.
VYEGADSSDYQAFRSETSAWSKENIPVFPALGNHEFKGCPQEVHDCLENWWSAFDELPLRPRRWYSVAVGPSLLALVLDSDAALKPGTEQRTWFEEQLAGADEQVKFILILLHYPPVRDPFFPRMRDEKEIARYLSAHARSLPQKVLVVGSHVHNYERYSRDGVMYVVSGGGGATHVWRAVTPEDECQLPFPAAHAIGRPPQRIHGALRRQAGIRPRRLDGAGPIRDQREALMAAGIDLVEQWFSEDPRPG